MLTVLAASTLTAAVVIALPVVVLVVVAVMIVRRRRWTPDVWEIAAHDERRQRVLAHIWQQQDPAAPSQPYPTSQLAMELQEPRDLLETTVDELLRGAYLLTDATYADGSRSVRLTRAGYDSMLYYLYHLYCLQNHQS